MRPHCQAIGYGVYFFDAELDDVHVDLFESLERAVLVRMVGEFMSKKFPLIAKWLPGMEIQETSAIPSFVYVRDLEAELAKGTVVYDGDAGTSLNREQMWGVVKWNEKDHVAISSNFRSTTREALLIGARPITQDDAESLLREMMSAVGNEIYDVEARARAFLAREGK